MRMPKGRYTVHSHTWATLNAGVGTRHKLGAATVQILTRSAHTVQCSAVQPMQWHEQLSKRASVQQGDEYSGR
jgi:hypothetical protein